MPVNDEEARRALHSPREGIDRDSTAGDYPAHLPPPNCHTRCISRSPFRISPVRRPTKPLNARKLTDYDSVVERESLSRWFARARGKDCPSHTHIHTHTTRTHTHTPSVLLLPPCDVISLSARSLLLSLSPSLEPTFGCLISATRLCNIAEQNGEINYGPPPAALTNHLARAFTGFSRDPCGM